MCRVDHNRSDVVCVGLVRVDLLKSVVVEDSYKHVVRASHYPTLPHHKL